MSKEYIIQKAVEPSKVVKKNRLTIEQMGERFFAFKKYDGCCAILMDGKTFSRTGEEYQCLNEVAEYLRNLYPDWVFIGEAWWAGKDQFNLISGEFRRQQVSDKLMFVAHDFIPREDFDKGYCTIPFKYRGDDVGIIGHMGGRIIEAEGYAPGSYGCPQAFCNQLVEQGGYDGLVLRDPDGMWTVGSGTQGGIIKIKRKLSFDLRVLEVNVATGEKTGRNVYKLVCDFRGLRLGVGSGVPHKLDDVPSVGDIVEVEAMDYSSDGLLREPRFKGIRFDKTDPDAG